MRLFTVVEIRIILQDRHMSSLLDICLLDVQSYIHRLLEFGCLITISNLIRSAYLRKNLLIESCA
jgi:hypothetical protein